MVSTAARTIDWEPLREAYIERPQRPTYVELEEEFGVKNNTIARCASEEGWPMLRASFLERKVKESDASAIILAAVQVDRGLVRSVANFALVTIARCTTAVELVDESKAAATKLDAYNTATFAVKNICDSLRSVGIVGLPKGMADNGKEDNGRWNPQMLQQINLTVQNLTAQAKGSEHGDAKPAPVAPSEAKAPAVETDLE